MCRKPNKKSCLNSPEPVMELVRALSTLDWSVVWPPFNIALACCSQSKSKSTSGWSFFSFSKNSWSAWALKCSSPLVRDFARSVAWNRFLTALSVRPGSILVIYNHCEGTMVKCIVIKVVVCGNYQHFCVPLPIGFQYAAASWQLFCPPARIT